MRKNLLLICLGFLILQSSFAQSGKVYDNLSLKSTILKSERNFALYLPPDYETSQRSYPGIILASWLRR